MCHLPSANALYIAPHCCLCSHVAKPLALSNSLTPLSILQSQKVNWLNQVCESLWPSIRGSLQRTLKTSIGPMINRKYKPNWIQEVHPFEQRSVYCYSLCTWYTLLNNALSIVTHSAPALSSDLFQGPRVW